jgi:hypothetical protein
MGDLKADPRDRDSSGEPIRRLLSSERFNTSMSPSGPGGAEQARLQGGSDESHVTDAAEDTGDFDDWEGRPGNLRLDYVLPSADLRILRAPPHSLWPHAPVR